MVDDAVPKVKEESAMTKEEEEEEREAQELQEFNRKNTTIKNKEDFLAASREARDAQEAAEGAAATHCNLAVCFLCAAPSTSTCEVCRLVGFCGEQHAKLHRPEEFCFPFMVEQREGVGRWVITGVLESGVRSMRLLIYEFVYILMKNKCWGHFLL